MNDKLGSIDVNMGDGNTVGHIGHIVYETPPPPPNSIYQNGKVVGVFEGQPVRTGNEYSFPALVFVGRHDNQEFMVQGIRLKHLSHDIGRFSSIPGFGAREVFQNVKCEILG